MTPRPVSIANDVGAPPSASPSPAPAPAPAPAPLAAGDELLVERAESAGAPSVLLARREARRHRLRLTFNPLLSGTAHSGDMSRALIADGRETVGALERPALTPRPSRNPSPHPSPNP